MIFGGHKLDKFNHLGLDVMTNKGHFFDPKTGELSTFFKDSFRKKAKIDRHNELVHSECFVGMSVPFMIQDDEEPIYTNED